ncbi:type IV pilin protein [Ralstonia solanacearum]|uniref:Pilus assembly protein PilE n=1 Tax=Ralstonia solanacearum K60 TaxID=1091042 RepID=A0AAP8D3E9_RALSL|nr:type IV pilin protein [Ralstonia solanacearum]MBT1537417.1 type IV pilin protein [Ralstonia solanacearum]OYQ12634.1 pilus assembly protein PilE [Ralstonia solanacearum K60]QOK82972.1 type IV pilin protein [Ralstonia solanacearum]RIJ87561.1 type IV pilin protein [Ralstonia solanacearum]CCF96901.1 Putative type IV pilus assembly protein PilE [Ralstonia solanacearum K60]
MYAQRSPDLPHQRGFTLIELMIVVVVIAILSMVAYPAYTQFVQKGRRTQAKATLMEDMQLFERHFAQANTYAVSSTNLTQAWDGFRKYSGDTQTNTSYQISAVGCSGSANVDQCVELRAQPPNNGKDDPTCGTLVYRSTGEKLNILFGKSTPESPTTTGCW